MLATLLRGPSFTLAVTSCFRGVALHIAALAIATTSSRTAARTAEPQQWRVRAALEAVALIRLLDITPQALRWHLPHALMLVATGAPAQRSSRSLAAPKILWQMHTRTLMLHPGATPKATLHSVSKVPQDDILHMMLIISC